MLKLKNILTRSNICIIANKVHLIKNYNTSIFNSKKLYVNTLNNAMKMNFSEKINKNNNSDSDMNKNAKNQQSVKLEENKDDTNSESKFRIYNISKKY